MSVFRSWFVIACLCAAQTVFSAPVIPPGFEMSTYFHAFSGAVAIAWAPDGALWIAQSGPGEGMHLWLHRDGTTRRVYSFAGTPFGERGIHAIAVDPDYATNGRLWVYYTVLVDPVHNRLSHFTNTAVTGERAPGDDALEHEVAVLDGPPVSNAIHNGGCLAFASDATLFLGMGDDNLGSAAAQNPFDLRGKILHLRTDGTAAADNPFLDGVGGDPRVWALGVRNPYRCDVQPATDNLFISDVGAASWEEINVGIAGGNFGWAHVEGPVPPGLPGYVYPTWAYPHDGMSSAAISGAHARPGDFDPAFEGDYFFADWARSQIFRMVLDSEQRPVSVESFASDVGATTDLAFGPDGALYMTTLYVSGVTVSRLAYFGGENRQPAAVATATPASGAAPLAVTLDGSGSSDPEGEPLSYSWDLGDGTTASEPGVVKAYPPGVYDVLLAVEDPGGLSDVAAPLRIVSGNQAPEVELAEPLDGQHYDAGQMVAYSGIGNDPEEGALPCSQLGWQVVFHHGSHTHPFLGPEQGLCGGTFTIPQRGEPATDVSYTVHLFGRDSGAPLGADAELTTERVVRLLPNISMLSLRTEPYPDLLLELDGVSLAAPSDVDSVVGMIRRLGAQDDQLRDGRVWRWVSWSDDGAASHDVATPPTATTYTATFACGLQEEVRDLRLDKRGDEIDLTWTPIADDCLGNADRYRVYAATDARPALAPGSFPDDPGFAMVATSPQSQFSYSPEPEQQYFLVVGIGADARNGPAGHYP